MRGIVGRALSIVASVLLVTACSGNSVSGLPQPEPDSDAEIEGIPEQTLFSASMRQLPIPGWRTTDEEIGLPPGSGILPLANVDERAILLGITDTEWWVVGLDVSDGKRFLEPVFLGPADRDADVDCYVNGPPMVLCVWHGPDPNTPSSARVIDTAAGKVVFEGPIDARVAGEQGQPLLEQVGDYTVVAVNGRGIHGVGPQGERTWFLPGAGMLSAQFSTRDSDARPSGLAVQRGSGPADIVFSVADGTIVKPDMPQDVRLGSAVVYPGGFGYEYTTADFRDHVALFDTAGARRGPEELPGTLENRSVELPMVLGARQVTVMTAEGRRLLELTRSLRGSDVRLVGTRLFITAGEDGWRQFDLRTGEPEKTCEGKNLGAYYIGSDGEVVVAGTERSAAHGVDLASCETLWTLPQRSDQVLRVWKVHDQLIQRVDDQLSSLVAPS